MADQKVSNRVVFARVAVSSNLSEEYVEGLFDWRGWHHFAREDCDYILAIPVYSAKSAALSVARSELADFNRQELPLTVDELRLVEPLTDHRRIVSINRAKGGWGNLFPKKWRRSAEMSLQPLNWEIAVPRSVNPALLRRRAEERKAAQEQLKTAHLPGEEYDPVTMSISSRAEPVRTVENPWEEPKRYLGFILLVVLGALVSFGGSVLAWMPTELPFRIAGGLISTVIVAIFARWASGDRLNRGLRIAGGLAAWLIAAAVGLPFRIFIEEFGDELVGALKVMAGTGACVVFLAGLVHLVAINPEVKKVWSLTTLTALVALVATGAQYYAAAWIGAFGVPSDDVAIPGWFRIYVAGYFLVWLTGGLVSLGGTFGWVRYFGVRGGGFFSESVLKVAAGFFAVLWILLALAAAIGSSQDLVADWGKELSGGETPPETAEFLYAACKYPADGSGEGERIVVLQGKDGNAWIVESKDSQVVSNNPEKIDFDKYAVLRSGGQDSMC
ncbi:hypothetical protein [Brachybacterium sp. ACRRE]|uniref:hypothetical protein n=1 Tax=Brachybacterium sp. ACRRE TaxID=2918184 RepID=UPI001EF20AFB|nr:hypothetical protein [Brachybacterium sp. ACRRE]MCG7311186.1 hypothetical protein [Brachybacterium sp. ACRRE]